MGLVLVGAVLACGGSTVNVQFKNKLNQAIEVHGVTAVSSPPNSTTTSGQATLFERQTIEPGGTSWLVPFAVEPKADVFIVGFLATPDGGFASLPIAYRHPQPPDRLEITGLIERDDTSAFVKVNWDWRLP